MYATLNAMLAMHTGGTKKKDRREERSSRHVLESHRLRSLVHQIHRDSPVVRRISIVLVDTDPRFYTQSQGNMCLTREQAQINEKQLHNEKTMFSVDSNLTRTLRTNREAYHNKRSGQQLNNRRHRRLPERSPSLRNSTQ